VDKKVLSLGMFWFYVFTMQSIMTYDKMGQPTYSFRTVIWITTGICSLLPDSGN